MNIEKTFHLLVEDGVDEQAAAMLCVAIAINELRSSNDMWSHQLCLGIRKGLFGAHADDSASIHDQCTSSAGD